MPINTVPHVHQIVICGNVFVRKEGKYLVLRRSEQKRYAPGFVHPMGGKIDQDEDPLVGALRELQEEAGVTVKNVKLEAVITEITPIAGESENWLIFHFSGDYESGEVTTTEEGELVWLTAEEVKGERLFPSVKEIIGYILDEQAGTVFATFAYNAEQEIQVRSVSVCQQS